MHIKYPKQRAFFTWEELGCLARALGYQKNLFYKNIPAEYHKEKIPGLDIKTLMVIMDLKVLHGDLHRTYNMHDALYNSRVIEKSLDMLSYKYLSFQELHEVRVAFQLYEHEDMLGLVIDEHILLRTLKACGRSVSPIKLMQHIKHTETHAQDRLLLYEFMELLLLCERESDVVLQPTPQASGIDPRNSLYKICDFKSILVPQDDKKIYLLDRAYEQSLSKPHVASKTPSQASWREEQHFLVDVQPRIEMVSRHRPATIELTDHLNHSNKKVLNARCGRTGKGGGRAFVDLNDVVKKEKRHRRELKIDTPFEDIPEREMNKDESPASRVNFSSSPPQEYQFTLDRPSTTDSQSYLKSFPGTTPQKLSRMSRTRDREILVTPRDVHNASAKIENLNWEIETQCVRLQRKSDKYLRDKHPQQYQIIKQRIDRRKPKSRFKRRELMQSTDTKVLPEDNSYDLNLDVRVSPRRYNPTRDTIYTTLKSRLQTNDTLLDYGDVEVPYSPFSEFLSKQLQRKKSEKLEKVNRNFYGPRTLKVENLGSLPDEEDLRSKHENTDGEVLDLLEKFQEADFVATGRKVFGQNDKHQSWKYTTIV